MIYNDNIKIIIFLRIEKIYKIIPKKSILELFQNK